MQLTNSEKQIKTNSSHYLEIRVEIDETETKKTISKSKNLKTDSSWLLALYSTSLQLETEASHEGDFTLNSIFSIIFD